MDKAYYRIADEMLKVRESLIELKPGDRSERDRIYAICLTELDKLYAFFAVFGLGDHGVGDQNAAPLMDAFTAGEDAGKHFADSLAADGVKPGAYVVTYGDHFDDYKPGARS